MRHRPHLREFLYLGTTWPTSTKFGVLSHLNISGPQYMWFFLPNVSLNLWGLVLKLGEYSFMMTAYPLPKIDTVKSKLCLAPYTLHNYFWTSCSFYTASIRPYTRNLTIIQKKILYNNSVQSGWIQSNTFPSLLYTYRVFKWNSGSFYFC